VHTSLSFIPFSTLLYPSLSFLLPPLLSFSLFFFNDPATTEIYTLSLHDALPILLEREEFHKRFHEEKPIALHELFYPLAQGYDRSEEHTSELQSLTNLVCRLLLEKKKKKIKTQKTNNNTTRKYIK